MIGIIGGAGPLASALLYQIIIEEHYRRIQRGLQCPLPDILLLNHNFTKGLTIEESTANRTCLVSELEDCMQPLRKAGATKIYIACNTLHSFLPNPLCADIIHLPQKVMATLRQQKISKVGVLSTETTKQAGLYSDALIDFVFPSHAEQQLINPIFDRILEGRVLRNDSLNIQSIIRNMQDRHNMTAIILGCTDLPVLYREYPFHVSGIAVFDSIRILAEEVLGSPS